MRAKEKPLDTKKKSKGGQPRNTNAEKWTEEKAIELGERMIDWMMKHPCPFYKDFLQIHEGLNKCTLNYLSQKFNSFSSFKKRAKKIQRMKLREGALTNVLNTGMSIFMLKNHHGYKDKQEVDQNTKVTQIVVENIGKGEPNLER